MSKKRIGLISPDLYAASGELSPSGCAWYRILLPHDHIIANMGDEVELFIGKMPIPAPDLSIGLITIEDKEIYDLDVVLIQRWMSRPGPEAVREARAAGQKVIVDIDDNFWNLPETNLAARITDETEDTPYSQETFAEVCRQANVVTVSTPHLKTTAEEFGAGDIRVIRNAIDGQRYPKHPVRDISDSLVVGWVGDTSRRGGDLKLLAPSTDKFLNRVGGYFLHGGHDPDRPRAHLEAEVISRPTIQLPTCSIYEYPYFFAQMDIGVAPLTDKPFNYSKSAIKIMEYAASGRPFICSPRDEYKWFGVGEFADTPDEWLLALEKLREPRLRAEAAEAGLVRVSQEDISVRWEDWAKVWLS